MAECRACLTNNVPMHIISSTRYREMFEKLTETKLAIEDGRPETICHLCCAQLEKSWMFFQMAQNTENIITSRLLEVQETEPEVTVTVKEEIDDEDEWQLFQDEFMDSPSPEIDNEQLFPIQKTSDRQDPQEIFNKNHLSMPNDNSSISKEILSMPNDHSSISKESLSMPDDHSSISKEILSMPNDHSSTSKEILSMPNDNSSTSMEFLSMPKDQQKSLPEDINSSEHIFKSDIKIKNEAIEPIFNENIEYSSVMDNIIGPLKADLKFHPAKNREAFYYCTQCHYRCQHSKTLRKHSRVHDASLSFPCPLCRYRFADARRLAAHRNYCTVCNVCGKTFHNLNGLRIHVRLHTGEQPYSCDLCGRGFNQKTNLQTHLRVHAREKQYPCEICNKIFPFNSYLKRHILLHNENQDSDSLHRSVNCHKLFNRKKKAMSTCTVCGKILRKDSMLMHMRLHTGQQPFSCEKCHRCFNQKCNLLTHVERVHPGDEMFACKVCYKTFAMNSELRKHIGTHGMDVEVKDELLKQTEKTLENIISRYEKEMEQRMEKKELTEMEKKMELILNLGLKPRVTKPVQNGVTNLGLFAEDKIQGIKRKDISEVVKTKRKKINAITQNLNNRLINAELHFNTEIDGTVLPTENIVNNKHKSGVDDYYSLEYLYNPIIEMNNSHVPDKIATEINLNEINNLVLSKNVDKKPELTTNIEVSHIAIVTTNNETADVNTSPDTNALPLKRDVRSDCENDNSNLSKTKDSVNLDSKFEKDKAEISSDTKEKSAITVLKLNNGIFTDPAENNTNTPNEVLENDEIIDLPIDSEDLDKNKSEAISNKEEISESNKEFEDIEHFDDSIEVLELELSDTEYQNTRENEEFTSNEDLEVSSINHQEDLTKGFIAVTSDEEEIDEIPDFKIPETKQRDYTGVEISVIDPDDVDEEEYEEEYLDSSEDDSIIINDSDDDTELDSNTGTENNLELEISDSESVKNEDSRQDLISDDENVLDSDVEEMETQNIVPKIKMRTDLFNSNNNSSSENHSFETNLSINLPATDDKIDISFNDNLNKAAEANVDNKPLSVNTAIYVNDFNVFQQRNIFTVHRQLNNVIRMPVQGYPCDMCGIVTKVLSY